MTTVTESTLTEVRSPSDDGLVGTVQRATPEAIDEAVEDARVAGAAWARTPRHRRYELMNRFAAALAQESDALATVLARESGKTKSETVGEVALCGRLFRGFAERMMATTDEARFLDTQAGSERDVAVTKAEPLGVVVSIIPFNFPVELFAHKVAPAIAMGNTVVVKAPEEDPLAVQRLGEIIKEVGFPDHVVTVLHGEGDVGARLVAHPDVKAVSLTGSTETGLIVAREGAKTLKRVFLELGSNDPMIVLEDADIEAAVDAALFGRSIANGQCCCATKRLLVHDAVADAFTAALQRGVEGLSVGDPLHAGTDIGPLISERAAQRVGEQVAEAVSEGARLLTGGSRDRAFFAPTILTDVPATSGVAGGVEIFGPVLPIVRFSDQDEAVEIANRSPYGLSGSVFSSDVRRAWGLAEQLDTGQVVINGSGLYRSERLGFGGFKLSGNAREGLDTTLNDYVRHKDIVLPGFSSAIDVMEAAR
jgi:succinate-semialdehyde dehydrogenase/glutarate-semialdehyde dehydrogenase